MKYVLYEGQGGDMLFTKEEKVKENPSVLEPFTNKSPTFTVDADNDGEAVLKLNEFIISRGPKQG
jgi:hypothetical protein